MSKNKGMSRGGRLLALLAVLAVLFCGYFIVTNVTQKEAVIETGGSFEVAGLTPDEITAMQWQSGDETIRLVRADGAWSLDGEANFPLKQDVADDLASDIAALEATHTAARMRPITVWMSRPSPSPSRTIRAIRSSTRWARRTM